MNKTNYYRQKLTGIPTRMGVGEVKKWLLDIDLANDFSELEPLLNEYDVLYPNEPNILFQYMNIMILFNYKFIHPIEMNSYSGKKMCLKLLIQVTIFGLILLIIRTKV